MTLKSLFSTNKLIALAFTLSSSYVSASDACLAGLFAVDRYAEQGKSALYHIDLANKSYSKISGTSLPTSNLAAANNQLIMMQRLSKETNASKIYQYDLSSGETTEIANTTSYPIKRSVVSPDGSFLLATSQTYMYLFDLETGNKTVMGKMQANDASWDDFKHGDITYSIDGNTVYVLNAKSLYILDESNMQLDKIGEHNLNWPSGIATANDGQLYVSARNNGENAKIYKIDPQTAEAEFVMEGPEHIADLTYVSECGNPLLTIADEFQQEINEAKAFWEEHNIASAAANVPSFKDGSFNFNKSGYLVESKDRLNKHNKNTKKPNSNRCARLWNNLLDHKYTLNRAGAGRKKSNGDTKWYHSTADGAFKVSKAKKGVCTYTLNDNDSLKLKYDSNTGLVSIAK